MRKLLDEFFKLSLSSQTAITVTLCTMFFLIGYDGGALCDGKIWEIIPDVVVEIHGFLFDLLIVVLLLEYFQKKDERRKEIQLNLNTITDFRDRDTEDASIKTTRAIKNLVELGYKGISLFKHNMKNCQINDLDLTDSDFYKTDFRHSRFNDSSLKNTNFNACDLRNVYFIGGADYNKATFYNCTYDETSFVHTKLNGAIFSDEELYIVGFNNCELKNADFSKANLEWVSFTKSDLTGADLRHARVKEDWFSKLDEWEVIGRETIKEKYKIENGILEPHNWLDYK